mmetsp:Transcript_22485/g.66662  ORF Transcript_22485/g.66662 Transcript_22485/m.66662 type:complete len:244 (+) Transcript_22485:823-1554(+)
MLLRQRRIAEYSVGGIVGIVHDRIPEGIVRNFGEIRRERRGGGRIGEGEGVRAGDRFQGGADEVQDVRRGIHSGLGVEAHRHRQLQSPGKQRHAQSHLQEDHLGQAPRQAGHFRPVGRRTPRRSSGPRHVHTVHRGREEGRGRIHLPGIPGMSPHHAHVHPLHGFDTVRPPHDRRGRVVRLFFEDGRDRRSGGRGDGVSVQGSRGGGEGGRSGILSTDGSVGGGIEGVVVVVGGGGGGKKGRE